MAFNIISMVLPASYRGHALVAIAALVAGGSSSSSMFASALELTVADCSDLAALPSGLMTEDVNLFLDDAMAFTCDDVSNMYECVQYPLDTIMIAVCFVSLLVGGCALG